MSLYDLDAEQAVLGGCLLTNAMMAHAHLGAEHFYDPLHGLLWEEMRQRYRDGRLIDATTLRQWVDQQPGFKEIGGLKYVAGLMESAACMSAQVAQYSDIIRGCWRRRNVATAAREALAQAERGEGDALTALEQRLQEIAAQDADADAWTRLGDVAIESVERAELGETKGISTGIARLDEVTGGFRPRTLWVAGGATSMGKSIIGAFFSRAIASQGYGVGEVHLEMDALQIGLRTASALAFQPDHRAENPHYLTAQRGALKPDQWAAMRGAAKASTALPIYTDARPGRTLSQIEAAARRLFQKMRREGVTPGALLIDHEGLIAAEPGARFPSQLERTNARSEGLLAMAKRLNVCVIALSQITKEGSRADGEDRLPNLTDLNYGGAISQAADVVMLIHREAYHEERKPQFQRDADKLRSRRATLVVDKARGGQRSHVEVLMDVPTAAVWAP